MTRHMIFGSLLFILIWVGRPPSAPAEVGYVNILNGIEPAKAFVVERQGQSITPEGVYTDLEEGDVVKPAAEALLLFTPLDAACEAVEIEGQFTVSACPAAPGGLKDAAYDFVTNEFMAAPSESVGVFATRGVGDKRLYSLPPQALRLFIESPDLAESMKKTPFVALTTNKAEAEALILGQGSVQLLSSGESGGRRFQLPAEGAALRQALLRRINFKTMAALASPGPWPAVEWRINIHAPDANGPTDYDGQKWSLVQTMKAADSENKPIAVQAPCALTFNLVNRSQKPYYAYLVNYTAEGQILPLLPPEEAPLTPNLVAPGADLSLNHIVLELGEGQENVRLILSENPLDLSQFKQDSLDEEAGSAAPAARLRPAPNNSWHTLSQPFAIN